MWQQESLFERGRLSTIDPVIRVACFVKKENNILNKKAADLKLVSTRRSTVLNLPLSVRLPWWIFFLTKART